MREKIPKQDGEISNEINNNMIESTGVSEFQNIRTINPPDLSQQSKEAPAPLLPDSTLTKSKARNIINKI